MQGEGKIYLTKEGKEKLLFELKELEGPRRDDIAARLKSAIEMGDLSENADYHKAKEDQGFLEGKILEIKYTLNFAIIVEENVNGQDTVNVGCKVTIQEEDFPPETYYLVGSKEADPTENKISHISPIGKALLDKQVGEIVQFKTPNGEVSLKILSID
ncbi:MAG: transcription elongation factor GreA [Anaerolineales bacterium]|nr:transcription elongation factor GreA [Anaerolineales bacterium]